ncbi:hypothetical protein FRC12_012616, partial [Ceratobasidium sp. 428]
SRRHALDRKRNAQKVPPELRRRLPNLHDSISVSFLYPSQRANGAARQSNRMSASPSMPNISGFLATLTLVKTGFRQGEELRYPIMVVKYQQ